MRSEVSPKARAGVMKREKVHGSTAEQLTLEFRPIYVDGCKYQVSRMTADYACADATKLFRFLMSPAGFMIIDDTAESHEVDRAAAHKFAAPNGCEGFETASVIKLPRIGATICPNAFYWDERPERLVMINYPIVMPREKRSPEAQAVQTLDWVMTYAMRLQQKDEKTARMCVVMWAELLKGTAMHVGHVQYYTDFHKRMLEHLASAEYSAP